MTDEQLEQLYDADINAPAQTTSTSCAWHSVEVGIPAYLQCNDEADTLVTGYAIYTGDLVSGLEHWRLDGCEGIELIPFETHSSCPSP